MCGVDSSLGVPGVPFFHFVLSIVNNFLVDKGHLFWGVFQYQVHEIGEAGGLTFGQKVIRRSACPTRFIPHNLDHDLFSGHQVSDFVKERTVNNFSMRSLLWVANRRVFVLR